MNLPDPYPVLPWHRPCRGRVRPPGSKSLTNRALVLGALANGPVRLRGALFSRDSRILMQALRNLGFVLIVSEEKKEVRIHGQNGSIPRREADLHVGNAGTAARFLTALVCLREGGRYRFDGDAEMRRRPMDGLIRALQRLGARFTFQAEEGKIPFTVETGGLVSGLWEVEAGASSQMLSALLMVAPFTGREVHIHCERVRPPFVEMTRRLMARFGVPVEGSPTKGFSIPPMPVVSPDSGEYSVEADATAASYFLSLPLLVGGHLAIEGLATDSLQGDLAYAGVLRECGLRVQVVDDAWCIQYVTIEGAPRERVFDFEFFSDTFLTFAAVAPFLPFPVRITGIGHTRFQECDRVEAAAAALQTAGAEVRVEGDDLCIGKIATNPPEKALVETCRDHRVAMAFALAGCRDRRGAAAPWLWIRDPACVGKTYPAFFAELERLYRIAHDGKSS